MEDTPKMHDATTTKASKALKKLKGSTDGEFPVAGEVRNNDAGNAKRLVRLCGHDILFVKEAEEWFVWDGKRWVHDLGHVEMLKRAKAVAETIYAEALEQEDDNTRNYYLKFAIQAGFQARLKAMIESARSEARVVSRSDFDQNPWLFNCQNGTINLRTGELKSHDRNDLITKISPVRFDPTAKASRFEKFMMEVMLDDEDKVKFLQRCLGYSMTGDTSEECFFVLWGSGRNGKGKLKDTFNYILGVGQYAQPAQFDMFVAKKGDEGKPNDIAALFGARFVSASEGEHSKRLAEAKIKLMTGRDPVIGEHKYERSFSYIPTYKIWLLTNPKPRIVGTDEAIWDRIHFVPFLRYFAPHERDGQLLDKLIAEASGILNWLVEGCLSWQREGLNPPASIREATKRYKDEQNVLGHFIEDCCEVNVTFTTAKTPMYDAYRRWAEKNGEFVMTNTEFSDRFSQVFEDGRSGSKSRHWKGVGMKFERSLEDVEEMTSRTLTPRELEKAMNYLN